MNVNTECVWTHAVSQSSVGKIAYIQSDYPIEKKKMVMLTNYTGDTEKGQQGRMHQTCRLLHSI